MSCYPEEHVGVDAYGTDAGCRDSSGKDPIARVAGCRCTW